MRSSFIGAAVALLTVFSLASNAPAGEAEQILNQAAGLRQFTFLVFYRDANPGMQAMASTVSDGLDKRPGAAALAYVNVNNPAEKSIVDRFNVSRAPLPLTLAVAPNGAVTGVFSQRIADKNIDDSLVTPGKAACIKALQEGKLVFVCIDPSPNGTILSSVHEFQQDPSYAGRTVVVSLTTNDPAEARFFPQLGVDPGKVAGPMTIFMAPPGTIVGKFAATATKAQMAAALHAAGKCCEDPNCKHAAPGHASKPSGTTTPRQANQPAPRRN